MWISKKRFMNLVERVEGLEASVRKGPELLRWNPRGSYYDSSRWLHYRLSNVVEMILNHLNLKLVTIDAKPEEQKLEAAQQQEQEE